MVTDTVEDTILETQRAIWARKAGRSWRKLAKEIGVPYSILHAIGNDLRTHVSWATLCKVRVHLGLSDPGEIASVLLCPDCGAVHHARCHGKAAPVAVVVSGQPRSRKPSKAIRVDPQVFAALDADRKEHKRTWTEYLDGLLWDASH